MPSVAAFDPAGAVLRYASYFGGDAWDRAFGIAVDGARQHPCDGRYRLSELSCPGGGATVPSALVPTISGAMHSF